ncbi:TolC family protein [Capnocytophaga catalasegens]|uniref:Transporter n=1 Tax=Capnocytophaga catalasegens TaxID=1004260 RepID=A0AAV5AX62_9FLAO|nr:TolC family protein [Capnocytophaga catalasegens]GIZ15073.1 transporter [Capnocytophaga catalasegens]GJM50042.1 transporter [Capnocytophaga catalasegens]GJM53913.1 transporter [Capnocytophaga catalasegens]
MNRNRFLLIIVSFWAFTTLAQDKAYQFSLEEAIQFAIENNRSAKNASLDVEAARKKKWEATAMGLPQLSAKVDYQHFLKQQVTLIPAEFFGGQAGEFAEATFGTKQNVNASATLSQLIFDGSYLVGLQSAKVYLQISELSKKKSDIELRKTVVDAYANVLLSEESIRILEENKRVLEKNLNETKAIFENGLGEEENVEQLQITLANISNNLNNTKRLHELSKKMLNITLGLNLDDQVQLKDNLEQLTTQTIAESIEIEICFNLESNIDFKIASNSVRSQELLVKFEKSQSLPRLSAFLNGAYNAFDNKFSFFDTNKRWFGSALFGVSLEIPIFSSFMRSSKVQRSQIELEKSKNDLNLTKQQLQMQHDKALSDLQFAIEEHQTLRENLDLAKRIENKNQIKYTEGLATSFDLRQAQLQLYAAQQEFLQSMVNLLNKKEVLKSLQVN